MRVVLLGAPGAGKGTQAQRVCERLGMTHLSSGDLLRGAVAAGTPAGVEAKAYMDRGELVPDEVVFGVLFERLESDGLESFLLDGFPRNRAQAEELDRRLAASNLPLDAVVDLPIPDDRLVGRLTGRRICRACGRNFHVEFVPPEKEGVCDACGGELYQRSDDHAETVAQRLDVYHEQTRPLREHYERAGLLVEVDADRPIDAVTADLLETLTAGRRSRA